MSIDTNLEKINDIIHDTCTRVSRNPKEVTVVAVTKHVDVKTAEEVIRSGVTNLGENRADAFLEKYEYLGKQAIWHFIGTLQSRKVKDVIDKIDYLHSMDRISLAKEINKRAEKKLKCFVQVKTSDEETKQGILQKDVLPFVKEIGKYEKIEVVGLMTMAPFTADEEKIRSCFVALKKCQEEVQDLALDYAPCTELSMGMSNDYPIAIEEGATYIRLGTSLVGQ